MSDKFTEAVTPNGGIGEWDWLDPTEAIARLRAHYERQQAEAGRVLADIDAGRVEVFHQYGPWAAKGRRRVHPEPLAASR